MFRLSGAVFSPLADPVGDRPRPGGEWARSAFPLQAAKLKDVHVSHVLEQVLDIALKYNVRMPVDFVLLGKTILTIEGVAINYDPTFNITKTAKPYINKILFKNNVIINFTEDNNG